MAKLDYKKLNDTIRYTMWSTFKVTPGALGEDRDAAVAATREFLARYDGDDTDLIVRGFYDVSGMGDLLSRGQGIVVLLAYGLALAAIGRFTTFRRDIT